MAFFSEEEDEELGGGASTGPQSSQIVGSQGTVAGAPSNPAAQAPDKPGNFVGINTYLNANKNQAEKLGDQAANVINTSANEAKSGLNNIQNSFNQKAIGVQADQGAMDVLNQGAENLDQNQKKTLKDQYNAQYTGPQDLTSESDYGKVGGQINKAFQNISGSGTEQGRIGLVQQVNNKPRTVGMDTFDNALLSGGGGRQKLAQAAEANKDVNQGLLDNANIAAQQKAADAKALTDATRTQTQGAVTGSRDSLVNSLGQRVDTKKSEQEAYKEQIKNALNTGKLTAEQARLLDLDPTKRTFGLDLSKFSDNLSVADNDITKADVAEENEIQRMNALYELMGEQASPNLLGQKDGRFGLNLGYDFEAALADQKKNLTNQMTDDLKHNSHLFAGSYDPNSISDAMSMLGFFTTSPGGNEDQYRNMQQRTQAQRDALYGGINAGEDVAAPKQAYIDQLQNYLSTAQSRGMTNANTSRLITEYINSLKNDPKWTQTLGS